MTGFRMLSIAAAFSAAVACDNIERPYADDEGSAPALAQRLSSATACPAEQLSCGKQNPVLSDGRPFMNEEMGLSVEFPRGSYVCLGRSGDAPRGFYTWFGVQTNCAEPENPDPPGYMSIHSHWNALERTSPADAPWWKCKPLSSDVRSRIRVADLAFSGHRSVVCEERKTPDQIEITVSALAGPSCGTRAPAANYIATLGTRVTRLDDDLPRFASFLRDAKIGTPDVACPGSASHL